MSNKPKSSGLNVLSFYLILAHWRCEGSRPNCLSNPPLTGLTIFKLPVINAAARQLFSALCKAPWTNPNDGLSPAAALCCTVHSQSPTFVNCWTSCNLCRGCFRHSLVRQNWHIRHQQTWMTSNASTTGLPQGVATVSHEQGLWPSARVGIAQAC